MGPFAMENDRKIVEEVAKLRTQYPVLPRQIQVSIRCMHGLNCQLFAIGKLNFDGPRFTDNVKVGRDQPRLYNETCSTAEWFSISALYGDGDDRRFDSFRDLFDGFFILFNRLVVRSVFRLRISILFRGFFNGCLGLGASFAAILCVKRSKWKNQHAQGGNESHRRSPS